MQKLVKISMYAFSVVIGILARYIIGTFITDIMMSSYSWNGLIAMMIVVLVYILYHAVSYLLEPVKSLHSEGVIMEIKKSYRRHQRWNILYIIFLLYGMILAFLDGLDFALDNIKYPILPEIITCILFVILAIIFRWRRNEARRLYKACTCNFKPSKSELPQTF